MKNMTPWFLILSLLIGVPTFAFAQENTGTTVEAEATMEVSAPTETGNTGIPEGRKLPPRDAASGLPTGKSMNGTPGQPIRNMMEKRMDNASGTGQRPPLKNLLEKRSENGTSGRPMLPPGMKDDMKARMMMNASGTRTMGSGTPKMMERMQLLKDGKMDRKMDAAKAFIQNAGERMNNAIERLKKLSDRLDGAITKMKEKGVDTSNAESLIAIAKSKIAEAETAVRNALASIDAAKPTTTGTSTGQIGETTRQAIKDALQKAKDAIEAAHKALVEAVKALKATGGVGSGSSNNPGSATTTP